MSRTLVAGLQLLTVSSLLTPKEAKTFRLLLFLFLRNFFGTLFGLGNFPSFLEDFSSFFLLNLALFFLDPFALNLDFGEAFFFFFSFTLPEVESDFLATAANFLARIGPNPGTAVKALMELDAIDSAVPNPCFSTIFALAGPIPAISVTGEPIIVEARERRLISNCLCHRRTGSLWCQLQKRFIFRKIAILG